MESFLVLNFIVQFLIINRYLFVNKFEVTKIALVDTEVKPEL